VRSALILAVVGLLNILAGCKKSPPAKPVTLAIFEVVDCIPGRSRVQVRGSQEKYCIASTPIITEKDIAAADSTHDQLGQPTLQVELRRAGGERLRATTLRLSGQPDPPARLAILIDGELIMAPDVKGVIADSLVISGGLRQEEVEGLAASLNASRE
jgi:preprotein translocase subunit SecD